MTPAEKEALFKDFMLLVSLDGNQWAPLNDMKAVKDVLGIDSGEFGLGMNLSPTDGIWAFSFRKTGPGHRPAVASPQHGAHGPKTADSLSPAMANPPAPPFPDERFPRPSRRGLKAQCPVLIPS